MSVVFACERFLLRQWRDDDLPAFARMCADPRVMQFLGPLQTREESDAIAAFIRARMSLLGFGHWAVEVPGEVAFGGFVGLASPTWWAPFVPCVEIGWRLVPELWGRGLATDAARAALRLGFETHGLNEILAFTVPANVRSRAVMERLGMTRDPDADFDHPRVPEGSPLRRHVLYRLSKDAWVKTASQG